MIIDNKLCTQEVNQPLLKVNGNVSHPIHFALTVGRGILSLQET